VNGSWIDLAILAALGAVAEWTALRVLLHWRPAALIARNYRQVEVVSRGGATFAAPVAVGAVGAVLLGLDAEAVLAATLAAVLFGLLGWLDDARGATGVRGLKGHLMRLLRHREVTTGLVKALGGTGVGLWAGYMLGAEGWQVLPAGAVIALSANTLNALDARPGRATKLLLAASIAIIALTVRGPAPGAIGVLAVLLGAAAVFAPADLRERIMLGDTGANPLGAVLGISVVSLTSWPTWLAVAAGLLAFCMAADRWSLTAVMERTPGLGWLDRLGRRKLP